MQPVVYDAIVIGAGPAGASCAVWLAHLGFSPLILDASEQVGGLAAHNPFEDAWACESFHKRAYPTPMQARLALVGRLSPSAKE